MEVVTREGPALLLMIIYREISNYSVHKNRENYIEINRLSLYIILTDRTITMLHINTYKYTSDIKNVVRGNEKKREKQTNKRYKKTFWFICFCFLIGVIFVDVKPQIHD